MNKLYKIIAIFLLCMGSACSLDGDLTNPNNVSADSADENYLMNTMQLSFADFFSNAAGTVDPLVRMQAMTGGYRYQTAYNPSNMDGIWNQAYRGVLVTNTVMQPLAEAKGLTTHVAAGKIMEAYTWLTLVDIFGDVPQVEALKAAEGNFNPEITSGSDIYAYAIQLLTDART